MNSQSEGTLMYSPPMFNDEGRALDYIRVSQTRDFIQPIVEEFYHSEVKPIEGAIQLPVGIDFFEKATSGEGDFAERLEYITLFASNSISMYLNFNDEYKAILEGGDGYRDINTHIKFSKHLESKIGTKLDYRFNFAVFNGMVVINISAGALDASDGQLRTILGIVSYFIGTPILVIDIGTSKLIGYSYIIEDVAHSMIIDFELLDDILSKDLISKLLAKNESYDAIRDGE